MECEREGENGEPAEGRKFEKEENGDCREVGERKMDWRNGREGKDEREERPSLGQGRHDEGRRGRTRVRIAKRTKLGVVGSSSLPHGRGITDEEIYDSLGIFIFCACQWSTDGSSRDVKKDNEISI